MSVWILALLLLLGLVITVYYAVHNSTVLPGKPDDDHPIRDPGIAWKVPYDAYPELKAIYEKFKASCEIPDLPAHYLEDTTNNETFQKMKNDLQRLPDEEKYERYELSLHEQEEDWMKTVEKFKSQAFYGIEEGHTGFKEYSPRLGCFMREIPKEVESYATEMIHKLMARLNLNNRLDRMSDSRGTTYMQPGGFMEYHSNQKHFGGWRLYMHWLPQGGESYFVYKHPYDGSYRRIQDNNDGCNMFRIRKKPKKLLWHGIYSESAHRFSWGIWLPIELAQHLKTSGNRI